jgi:hypothetical protein
VGDVVITPGAPIPAAADLRELLAVPDPERGRRGPIREFSCPRCGVVVFSLAPAYLACGACPGSPEMETVP